MLEAKALRILRNGLLFLAMLTTLWMAPYSSLDPVSMPKMCILVFLSILLCGIWIPRTRQLIQSENRRVTILLLTFIFLLLPIVLFSGTDISLQIYGTYGRNTGALTYLALALVLLSVVFATDVKYLQRFIHIFVVLGVLLICYGQIQHQGWEPFPFQNAYGSNVFGTLGNPDFMSAFMGMVGAVSIGLALGNKLKNWYRAGLVMLTFLTLLIIYETHAKQGFLNFAAGAMLIFILWLFMNQKNRIAYIFSGLTIFGGGLVFLGIINLGPLAGYLYKASLEARGFYWRAAINMLMHHPIFGVGMDGYGEWYRRARNLEDTLVNPGITSDAAHNVFLDIASNGGFPLIIAYLAIFTLVVISIVKVVKRSKEFNPYFAAIAGAWIAYQTQSFISINAIGLAIWGWILSGLIIGYEINSRAQSAVLDAGTIQGNRKNTKQNKQVLSSVTVVSVFATTLTAAVLAFPPYMAANNFYKAVKSGNAVELQPAAYLKPYDRMRFTFVAYNLTQNNLNDRALVVIRDAAKLFPNSYEVWNILVGLPNANAAEIANAKAQLKRLDPHNPDLK